MLTSQVLLGSDMGSRQQLLQRMSACSARLLPACFLLTADAEAAIIQQCYGAPPRTGAALCRQRPLGAPRLIWPATGRIVVGCGGDPYGITIATPAGTPVQAVGAGVVTYAGNDLKGYGGVIVMRHPRDFFSVYAHAEDPGSSAAIASKRAK